MKRTIILLLFCFVSYCGSSQDKRNKERDIKTTDLYLYGEATADTQDEATTLAKKILASRVYDFEPGLINNSEALEVTINKSEHYISMPRGVKFRTIAFIMKSEVQDLAKKTALSTAGLPAIAPENSVQSASTDAKKSELVPANVVELNTKEEESSQSAEPTEQEESVPEITQKEMGKESEADKKQFSTENNTGEKEIRNSFSSGQDLLNYMITIDSARVLQKLFDEQKRKGMLIYGGKNTLSFPDKCYLVFYNHNGEVKAYLDKGRESRKNLRTGEPEELNKFGNEPFIWFQLMN